MTKRLLPILSLVLALFLGVPIAAQDMAPGDVRVGPGDVVKLKVFGQPDLSDLYEISPDGALTIPGEFKTCNAFRMRVWVWVS